MRADSRVVEPDSAVQDLREPEQGESTDVRFRTDVGRRIRGGTLQEILDAEYSRCYRREVFSGLYDELKGFIRRVVARDDLEGESLRSSFSRR